MNRILSVAEVLEYIEPVDPDNLQHQGNGIYRAVWGPPIGEVDLFLLEATPGVSVISKGHPKELPTWQFVDFAISIK